MGRVDGGVFFKGETFVLPRIPNKALSAYFVR